MKRASAAALLAWAAAGCDETLNNGDAGTPSTTLRVSLSSLDQQGDRGAGEGILSGDGTAVAFVSTSGQIHPESVLDVPMIYVKNLKTRELVLASREDGQAGAPVEARLMGLSRNGRRVAFICPALPPLPPGKDEVLYVRDLDSGETILASRADGPLGAPIDDQFHSAVLSGDGLHVAFSTLSNTVDPADTDARFDVYVRDLATGVTELASRETGAGGAKFPRHSAVMSISADGSAVAIQSPIYDPGPPQIGHPGPPSLYVRTRSASPVTTLLVAGGKDQRASLTDDGLQVAFSTSGGVIPEDFDGETDVFVRDLSTGAVELISRATGPSGPKAIVNSALGVRISGDGRFVVFESEAANLVPGDTNLVTDVFTRDRATSITLRVSVRTFGSQIGKGGLAPSISDDGRVVAFYSEADDIVDDDSNGYPDIFLRGPLR
ncbi:MAG TPA: hypothetical protein VF950_13495 [Planctomycetota bacterium]